MSHSLKWYLSVQWNVQELFRGALNIASIQRSTFTEAWAEKSHRHGQLHLLKWEDNCLKGHSNLSVISTFLTYRAWTHNITKLCSNYTYATFYRDLCLKVWRDLGFNVGTWIYSTLPFCCLHYFSLPISLQFGMTTNSRQHCTVFRQSETLPISPTINLALAKQCHVTVHLTGIQGCCSTRLGSGNPLSSWLTPYSLQ